MKRWARVALCATLIVLPSVASAQSGLTGRVRYLGGYTHETPAILGSTHDLWTGVVPELSYLHMEDSRWLMRATYAFTAAVHTRNAAEIANRLTLVSSYELSARTTLLLFGDASQTSLSNYLVTRPALDTSVVVLPMSNSRLLTTSGSEGLVWDASPRVRLGESLEATYVRSLDPETKIENFFTNLVLSADRSWKVDAVGIELRAGYASLDTAPVPEQKFVTLTPAPRWRHDLTPELSSSLSGGASLVVSPDGGARSIIVPYARASLLHTLEESSLELSYAGGTLPSGLTGQMLRSHLVSLRGSTPLSERNEVLLGASVGYLHGAIIDLRPAVAPTDDFDAVLADVDMSWQATHWLQLFARGLFSAQGSAAQVEHAVREAVVLGIQLSTQAPDAVVIPVRFPQRVDRADGPRAPR